VKELVETRIEGKTMVEDSPKRSSGSNGVVERAVQEVEGSIRAGFLALQHRVGRRIDARERLVAFLPEYMVYLMNRLKTGEDGKTVYERVRGKQGSVVGVEFGEKVLYKIQAGGRLQKINPRWEHGIFVGVRRRSNELLVSRLDGIKAVRSIRRIPFEKRWGEDCLNWVQWAPWHRYKGDEEEDGEVPEGVPADEVKEDGGRERKVYVDVRSPVPKDFYLTKEAAKNFGYTRGCGGCQSWFKGLSRAVHTEACRERFRVFFEGRC
jgi:hypothetical protein